MLLTLADEVVLIGERYYVKATATVTFDKESLSVSAYAREEEEKKGQDGSQITGTASSYARKYALNGLFNIDDTKDADTDEHHNQVNQPKQTSAKKTTGDKNATVDYHKLLIAELNKRKINIPEFAKENKLNAQTPQSIAKQLLEELTKDNLKKDLQDTFDKHHNQ